MANFKTILLLAISVGCLTIYSCKEDETPPVDPPEVLIIGKWQSVLSRDDGNVVTTDSYTEMTFRADNTVTISDFENDGTEVESVEDGWSIENDDKIIFTTEPPLDLIGITADSMTVEYNLVDPFSGQTVRRSDDYLKQE